MTTTVQPSVTLSVPADVPLPAPTATPSDRGAAQRAELAAFLRSRRERITPEQVGLARGPRRRTPGLRREEVAQLAAVGVTWYTWIEQARDIHVSAHVLDALARALLLDTSERSHLFALAGVADPRPGIPCPTLSSSLQRMMERLQPYPACVQNSRYDIVAYNSAYGHLLCDLDRIPPEDHNSLWLAFTHPDWRASVIDWEGAVRMMAAKFRAAMAEHLAEPAWKALLKRLQQASPEFREIWDRHEVVVAGDRVKRFRNRRVGLLNLHHTSLWLGPRSGPRMVTYVPADAESGQRLEELHALLGAQG
ncbi:helix-turn-helix transcriptional regulator [Streptomyces sp. URMC 123]|uniref:helix-turn-helix transcriptional regulator n=1 Tax=Streptomyces sp. URMC 123 TaxID=3423403 RepID=UPI003F1E2E02